MDRHDLTRCRVCKWYAVHPIMDESHEIEQPVNGWHLVLRCTNCEHIRRVNVTQKIAERFDIDLDREQDRLIQAAKRFERAVMEDEIDLFVKALNAGAILPEDFHA